MLYPLQAHERSPCGLFKLYRDVNLVEPTVEGGMVGVIVDDFPPDPSHIPVVTLYPNVPAVTQLVGLIDDSSSAAQGRMVDGIGVSIAPGVTPETGRPTGPATHLASGKCTLWLDPGTFVTDVWDTTDATLGTTLATTAVGTQLSVDPAGTAGLLQADVVGVRLGTFIRRFVGGQGPVSDFDSFFIPRVQPLPAGRIFMVFRFKS